MGGGAALKPFQAPAHPRAKRPKAAVTAYADELITLVGQGGGPLPLMVASHLLGFPGSQGDDALMDMWRVLDAGPDSTISTRAHLFLGCRPPQCPARQLASTVAAVGAGRLLERFSHPGLALPADQLAWRSSPFMRGLRSLPVRYELAPVPAGAQVSERSPAPGRASAPQTAPDTRAAGPGRPAALGTALSHGPDPLRPLTGCRGTAP
ncbi:hypothetical protein ACIBU0_28460 [Streptomyces sp. NPDC049627]|uniref:hypothetical protein n=1 Tax=Streptomyces sp. NPDC049627 TaxID=3365595 RepID=UPI0037941AB3